MAYENCSAVVKGKVTELSTTGTGASPEGCRNFTVLVEYEYQGKPYKMTTPSDRFAINQLEIPAFIEVTIDRNTGALIDCPLTISPGIMRVVFTKWHYYFGAFILCFMLFGFFGLHRHQLQTGGDRLFAIGATLFVTYANMALLAMISAGAAAQRKLRQVAQPVDGTVVAWINYFNLLTRKVPVVEYAYQSACYRRIPSGTLPASLQPTMLNVPVTVFVDPTRPDCPSHSKGKQDTIGSVYFGFGILFFGLVFYSAYWVAYIAFYE